MSTVNSSTWEFGTGERGQVDVFISSLSSSFLSLQYLHSISLLCLLHTHQPSQCLASTESATAAKPNGPPLSTRTSRATFSGTYTHNTASTYYGGSPADISQLSHCDTCKILGGGAYTLNQIVPKSALKLNKGGDSLKSYTYKGDSGTENRPLPTFRHTSNIPRDRQIRQLLLLPQVRIFSSISSSPHNPTPFSLLKSAQTHAQQD